MSQDFNYEEAVTAYKTMEDITGPDGLIQKIIKDAVQHVLQQEINEYIISEKKKGNTVARNGTSHKTLKTSYGKVDIDVPRTRTDGFEPEIVKRRSVVEGGLESQVVSMYAKGMTTRDIVDHVQSLYGIELSPSSVSNITDKIVEEAKEWYSRTLDSLYPVVFLDAVHFKVREEGRIATKAAYVALGINSEGYKDILGIWIGENEGAKFWLKVCSELKNRGVQDILVVCIDGLKGFPDAIHTVFPETKVQLCIIHQIRNTLKYVASKDQRAFMKDLKKVYGAESEEIAMANLETRWNPGRNTASYWRTGWRNGTACPHISAMAVRYAD